LDETGRLPVARDRFFGVGLGGRLGHNPKMRMLTHIKNRFGVDTFVGGHHTDRLNVKEFGSAARARPNEGAVLLR
jgi:hypothetical protein